MTKVSELIERLRREIKVTWLVQFFRHPPPGVRFPRWAWPDRREWNTWQKVQLMAAVNTTYGTDFGVPSEVTWEMVRDELRRKIKKWRSISQVKDFISKSRCHASGSVGVWKGNDCEGDWGRWGRVAGGAA